APTTIRAPYADCAPNIGRHKSLSVVDPSGRGGREVERRLAGGSLVECDLGNIDIDLAVIVFVAEPIQAMISISSLVTKVVKARFATGPSALAMAGIDGNPRRSIIRALNAP